MHGDPAAPIFVAIMLAILIISQVMTRFKQPPVVAYLLVGIILGPSVLGIVTSQENLSRLGEIGVILLLFFVGMEVSPKKLAANWLIPIVGTSLQVLISVLVIFVLGWLFSWNLPMRILVGFVISLSSTSVVLKLLQDWGEMDTQIGQNLLGILLVQDLLVIPMMIVLSLFSGHTPSINSILLQIVGGIAAFTIVIFVTVKEQIRLPFLSHLAKDPEGRVFVALLLCFGLATITSLLGLSTALGSFLAGLVVASTKETHWAHESLLPLKTIFLAIFFVSIGMLVDVSYLWHFFWQISFLVLAAFATNTLINAIILRILKEKWQVSLYQGSMLSQIGEFAFVLTAIGFEVGIISNSSYKMLITTIALTILLSPLWIKWMKNFNGINKLDPFTLIKKFQKIQHKLKLKGLQ